MNLPDIDPNNVDPKALMELGTQALKTAPALLDRLGAAIGTIYKPVDILLTSSS
jgi:hypothetical protein